MSPAVSHTQIHQHQICLSVFTLDERSQTPVTLCALICDNSARTGGNVLSDPWKKNTAERGIDQRIIEYTEYLWPWLNGTDSRRVTDAHLFKEEACWEIRMRGRRGHSFCYEVSGGK